MEIFKKRGKNSDAQNNSDKINHREIKEDNKIGKKKRIGFGKKNKKIRNEIENDKEEKIKTSNENEIKNNFKSDQSEENLTSDTTNLISDLENLPKKDITKTEKDKEVVKKRKPIIPRDLNGKPVFLEDTGEKIANVFDTVYDSKKNIIGYKIKDNKSDAILSFPPDQFLEDKSGLIFVPSWFNKANKTIEKLEFKERVSPELTTLLSDDDISNEELYQIFVKHDDQMANYIEEAISLKELLNQRLKVLEKQRIALKDNLMDLTEKRLIKDMDRRDFSENVMEHRRKVNVLDLNISKCKELIKRLEKTSFGKLGNQIINNTENINNSLQEKHIDKIKTKDTIVFEKDIQDPYKQKYLDIKEKYEQLLEDYDELKNAVGKLIAKDEI